MKVRKEVQNNSKRGRKKGSTSFTHLTYKELGRFVGSETIVPVHKSWLDQLGFDVYTQEQIDQVTQKNKS